MPSQLNQARTYQTPNLTVSLTPKAESQLRTRARTHMHMHMHTHTHTPKNTTTKTQLNGWEELQPDICGH